MLVSHPVYRIVLSAHLSGWLGGYTHTYIILMRLNFMFSELQTPFPPPTAMD